MIDYPFTAQDMQAASDDWGCNCGPSSLAFALQIGLDKVRGKIPGFEDKHYTSPTMMKAGLKALGKRFEIMPLVSTDEGANAMFPGGPISLVRIQWSGPWTQPNANPKWAYRQTHWVATWLIHRFRRVFDCNGGIRSFDEWQREIVPTLTALYPRADGGWFPTHVWRIGS